MIGLVIGLLLTAWQPQLPPLWLCSAGFFLAALALPYAANRGWLSAARALLGLLAGITLASAYGYHTLDTRYSDACAGRTLGFSGVVSSLVRRDIVREDTVRQRFEFSVESIVAPDCQGPRRLMLSYYGDRPVHAGERLSLRARLQKPWGLANPGGFNAQSWLAQIGIDGTGTVKSVTSAENNDATLRALHHRLRAIISDALQASPLSAKAAGILRAITVADRGGLSPDMWQLMQYFGVNHLLVISGLHVGMAAGLGYLLGQLLARVALLIAVVRCYRWLPSILAFGFALFYTILAGFSLSTQRALFMLGCILLANLARRSSGGFYNLLLAAAVLLTVNPLAGLGSGFWLSFSAVACLLWLGLWYPQQSLPGRLFATHSYMCVAMIPIAGWWFGGASLVAAAANFLLVPLVTFLLVPLALLGAALSLLSVPGYYLPWEWAAVCIDALLQGAEHIAAQYSQWFYFWLSPSPGQMLLAVLAAVLLVIPGIPVLRMLALVLAIPLALPAGPMKPETPTLTVFDAGQGTAVLFRSGDKTLLYDTGGGDPAGPNIASSVIVPALRRSQVAALDTLVISHPDNDHSSGAAMLLALLPVLRYRYGGMSAAPDNGGLSCRAGEAWQWPGGIYFQLLAPALEPTLSSNDVSCVLMIDVNGSKILLPGDISAARERALVDYWRETLGSEVLLAAHHGSRSSTSWALLKAVQPVIALFSYGFGNRFGHPHGDVIERAGKLSLEVGATGDEGALQLRFLPSGQIELSRWRHPRRYYWM